jgi:hypothetical protein
MLDKNVIPDLKDIGSFIGDESLSNFNRLDIFLNRNYELTKEIKFPFGNDYGWAYKYSVKGKLLCYLFFEKGSFTVTITIGKNEVPKLNKSLPDFLPKTKELWSNRYPCGEGGWIHYRVLNENELTDIQSLIAIKKKPSRS